MKRFLDKSGVTLIELLIVMAIMLFVITAASRLLTAMLGSFKQQTKIAESTIESTVGLSVLTRDLRSIGQGLPYGISNNASISYEEADTGSVADDFNDAPGIPRPFLVNAPASGTLNGSDYLVIRSLPVADNDAAGKYAYLRLGNVYSEFNTPTENLEETDWVMVVFVQHAEGTLPIKLLKVDLDNDNEWSVQYKPELTEPFAPQDDKATYFIYGITTQDVTSNRPRFPFNRADYYISGVNVPSRCAGSNNSPLPLTGVLVKTVLNQANGKFDLDGDGNAPDVLPLLDCVADMQVGVRLDTDDDGIIDGLVDADDIMNDDWDAQKIRTQVKEVRVYILAHDGQFDPTYAHPAEDQVIWVGEPGAGKERDLAELIGPDWNRYRWRVHTLISKPLSLYFEG